MEFFNQATVTTSVSQLQQQITIASLPVWCSSISTASASSFDKGEIYCLWGEFKVHRELIKDGIRFTLPGCPNALQWTLTINSPGTITLHCTLNQTEVDQDFRDSIVEFLGDWKQGLENWKENAPAKEAAPDNCPTLFGGFG